MCYTIHQKSTLVQLATKFEARNTLVNDYSPTTALSGFIFPKVPVITNETTNAIQLFHWGLLPHWTTDFNFKKNTLNARIETIAQKPSFKYSINKRCLVLVDGFYEYHGLDAKSRNKQKILITSLDEEPFALGGLWSQWKDNRSNEIWNTFTILTVETNPQIDSINGSSNRIPLTIGKNIEHDWLQMKLNITNSTIELKSQKV